VQAGDSTFASVKSSSNVTAAGSLITQTGTYLVRTTANLSNGAGAQTAILENAPATGNPTKWIPIDDNGTTRYIPAW
jgi:hypothetical protein